jgi:hypothetical protein
MAEQTTTVARRDVSATVMREIPDQTGLKCLVAHAKQLVDVPPEARKCGGSKYASLSPDGLKQLRGALNLTTKSNSLSWLTRNESLLRALVIIKQNGHTEILVRAAVEPNHPALDAAVDGTKAFDNDINRGRRLSDSALLDIAARHQKGMYKTGKLQQDAIDAIVEACAAIGDGPALGSTARVNFELFKKTPRTSSLSLSAAPALFGAAAKRKREEEKGRVDTVMGHVDVTKLPTGQLLFTFKNLSDAQMLPMPGGTAVVGTPVSDVPDE